MTLTAGGFTLPAATVRWGAVVAVAFLLLHVPFLAAKYEPNTWLYRDGAFYFTTLRAITEHGRLEQKELQPRSWYEDRLGWNDRLSDDWSNVALGREGRWYPKHPVLLPVLSIPLYTLFGTPGTLFTNVLLNLAFVLLVFLLARRVARIEIAALTATLVAAQPIVQTVSYWYSNDLLSAVLLLGALEAALGRCFRFAGILAGFALWSRVTNATYLPALVLVALAEGGWKAVFASARYALLPLGLFAGLNTWQFGAPWITPYQAVLVREGGRMTTASHGRLFNVPLLQGFRHLVVGADGAFAAFPLFGPGLLGLAVLARRRSLLAIALLLFCTLQAILLMKYDWYRSYFLYPAFGGSAVGLAALLGVLFPDEATAKDPSIIRIPRWIPLAALGLLVVAGVGYRASTRADRDLLSSRISEARVSLGEIPCDYWNPQNERWECSHFDQGEAWSMTGRVLAAPVKVQGTSRRGIWQHPNPNGKWRTVAFDTLESSRFELSFGLGDASRPGEVEIEILPRGGASIPFVLRRAGEEARHQVVIADGEGPALQVRVRAVDAAWKHLVWEGRAIH